MIFDRTKNLASYKGLSADMDRAIDYLLACDFSALPVGRQEIDGERVYMNVVELTTKAPDAVYTLEMHRRYIDIHIPLTGSEDIALAFEGLSPLSPYDETSDCAMYSGAPTGLCTLTPGTFLLCLPQDAHQSALSGNPGPLKKAIVKIIVG